VFDLPENQLTEPFKVCLVTDDSPIVRKIARRILRNLAFEVDEAENGRIALEKCEQRMPDVVLLDWNMPVMSGIEFLRSLRIMDGGGAPKVIVCTTESDVEHIREALETGADEYLMKPFDAGMLRTKLGCVISEGKSTAISASRP
jgi:two-component system, chemotaxis family, chemotaxis protein CheY